MSLKYQRYKDKDPKTWIPKQPKNGHYQQEPVRLRSPEEMHWKNPARRKIPAVGDKVYENYDENLVEDEPSDESIEYSDKSVSANPREFRREQKRMERLDKHRKFRQSENYRRVDADDHVARNRSTNENIAGDFGRSPGDRERSRSPDVQIRGQWQGYGETMAPSFGQRAFSADRNSIRSSRYSSNQNDPKNNDNYQRENSPMGQDGNESYDDEEKRQPKSVNHFTLDYYRNPYRWSSSRCNPWIRKSFASPFCACSSPRRLLNKGDNENIYENAPYNSVNKNLGDSSLDSYLNPPNRFEYSRPSYYRSLSPSRYCRYLPYSGLCLVDSSCNTSLPLRCSSCQGGDNRFARGLYANLQHRNFDYRKQLPEINKPKADSDEDENPESPVPRSEDESIHDRTGDTDLEFDQEDDIRKPEPPFKVDSYSPTRYGPPPEPRKSPRNQDSPRSQEIPRSQDWQRNQDGPNSHDWQRSQNNLRSQDWQRSQDEPRNQDWQRNQDIPRSQDWQRNQDGPKSQDWQRSQDDPRNQDRQRSQDNPRSQDKPRCQDSPRLNANPSQCNSAQTSPGSSRMDLYRDTSIIRDRSRDEFRTSNRNDAPIQTEFDAGSNKMILEVRICPCNKPCNCQSEKSNISDRSDLNIRPSSGNFESATSVRSNWNPPRAQDVKQDLFTLNKTPVKHPCSCSQGGSTGSGSFRGKNCPCSGPTDWISPAKTCTGVGCREPPFYGYRRSTTPKKKHEKITLG